jgi:hypothetical protein
MSHVLLLAGGLHALGNIVLRKDLLQAGLLHARAMAALARNCCGKAAAHDRRSRCCCH